jgi:GDP-mannose 6-dehydrogenase
MRLVCADTRLNISPAYMKPGFAFGGSCLPKDLRALAQIAKQHDIEVPMLASLLVSNRVHIDLAVEKILRLGRPRVGMIGLSFKSGTDDLRDIPHIGSLLCDDIGEMIDASEVLLVGLRQPALEAVLQERVRPEHHLIDLVNLPNRDLLHCHYEGICW